MSTIKELQPEIVWKNFYQITQIPRPSKHEEKMSKYLYDWGISHGIDTTRDKVGNIIFRKPATKGYENRKGVVLQGHMDMVPAKASDSTHDFLKDPIQTVIDGDWVKTKGTTLGADNGIGVALAMAVLESNDIEHGPLEVLVTIDEETGMTGANALDAGVLKGDILLNLDEEEEGALCVGCAGGLDISASKSYKPIKEIPDGFKLYTLIADKGEGGHSGQDIPLGRINSNKSVVYILNALLDDYGCLLSSLEGGSLRNAIPITTKAEILVPKLTEKTVQGVVAAMIDEILAEHHLSDPKALMTFTPSKAKATQYVKPLDARKFVKAMLACPHGVERMSEMIDGLAETSTNMALVCVKDGKFSVKSLTRSSVDSAKFTLAAKIKAVFELIGCKVVFEGGYSGWVPNEKSEILKVLQDVYKRLNGKEIKVSATHGGLECGILGSKYPHWDMIAFGPTLLFPHSPAEKLFIPSVGKTFEFIKEALKNIPVKA